MFSALKDIRALAKKNMVIKCGGILDRIMKKNLFQSFVPMFYGNKKKHACNK